MKILSLVLLPGLGVYFYWLLRGVIYVMSSILVLGNISIDTLRRTLLALRGIACFVLTLFLISLGMNVVLSWVSAELICVGEELASHLRKRTTAAFSTSDVQNQRMFNLSVAVYMVGGLVAVMFEGFNLNPFERFGVPFLPIAREGVMNGWVLVCGAFGMVFFLRYSWLVVKHSKTITYLFRSYVVGLKEGKLKRYW